MPSLNSSSPPWLFRFVLSIVTAINTLNALLGRCAAWLSVMLVVLMSYIVISRALFDTGSLALQESITYGHAALFMLCMGYTIILRGHVRVDVFYRRFSPLNKAWVDALGGLLLLLPFALFMTYVSWDFVVRAWQIREASSDPGGLTIVYCLKTLIPVTGILLALQALSEVLRNLLKITYIYEDSADSEEDSPC